MKLPCISFPKMIKGLGLPEPVPEYKFHPLRNWRVDYAFPYVKLGVEIEGGLFGKGKECPVCGRRSVAGHSSIERLKKDMEKYTTLALAGWSLLRFLPEEVENGHAANVIMDWFEKVWATK